MKHVIPVLALVAALAPGCSSRNIGTTACTPGEEITIACGCEGLGECDGNPVLRVCDGTLLEESCDFRAALAESDDAPGCGSCPLVRATCPASGSLLVVPRGFYPDELPRCAWQARPSAAP